MHTNAATDGYPVRYTLTPKERKHVREAILRRKGPEGVPEIALRTLAKDRGLAFKVVHGICEQSRIGIDHSQPPETKAKPAKSKPSQTLPEIQTVEHSAPAETPPSPTPEDTGLSALAKLETELRAEYDGKIEKLNRDRDRMKAEVEERRTEAEKAMDQARKATMMLRNLRFQTQEERGQIETLRADASASSRRAKMAKSELELCRGDFKRLLKICDSLRSTLAKVEEENQRLFSAAYGLTIDDVLKEIPE